MHAYFSTTNLLFKSGHVPHKFPTVHTYPAGEGKRVIKAENCCYPRYWAILPTGNLVRTRCGRFQRRAEQAPEHLARPTVGGVELGVAFVRTKRPSLTLALMSVIGVLRFSVGWRS